MKKKPNSLYVMWQTLSGHKGLYLVAVLLLGLGALISYAPPLIIRATIDSVIGTEAFTTHPVIGDLFGIFGRDMLRSNLWLPGLLLVGASLLQGGIVFLSGYLAAQSSEAGSRNLRDRLYRHLNRLPAAYHARAEKGDLLQRCTSDVDTVRKFMALQLVQVGNALFLVAAALIVTFSIHVPLALVSLPIIPLAIISSVLFFGQIQRTFKVSDEAEAALTTVVQEHLTGIRVVRAFGRESYEYGRFDKLNKNYQKVTMRLITWFAAFWASTDIMSLLQILAVISVGTLWAVQGQITLGTLLLFTSSVWMILWPVRQMGRVLVDMGKAFVAIERIRAILDEPEEEMNCSGLRLPVSGDISFEHVHFSYDGESPVLQDVSFDVKAGQTVGILGPTGAGKSTLVALLAGLYRPQQGRVLLNGRELGEYDMAWVRRNISLVLQEPFLYGRSIKRNIGIAAGQQMRELEVFEAARDASIHRSIVDFERGYDTPVGERGVTLSGGQKQRVAIARALMTNSPIMVFDDSLSALDTETDKAVQAAIHRRGAGRTVFMISHRVSTLAGADLILVLKGGRIIQQGSFPELVTQEGLFRTLWDLQTAIQEDAV
ncbi:ABC transporter ATP-binding protein [Spirochaeta dissipatitropha]